MTSRSEGFTLIELLLVIAIIAILATIFFLNDFTQYFKGYDAVRKSDLHSLQTAFENYYSDHDYYPYPAQDFLDSCTGSGDALGDYLKTIHCDPHTKKPYDSWTYPNTSTSPQKFVIFAHLDGPNNPTIAKCNTHSVAGTTACNTSVDFNYFVSSPDYILTNDTSTGVGATSAPVSGGAGIYYCQDSSGNCTELSSGKNCPAPLTYKTAYCDNSCTTDKFVCIPQ